MTNVGARPEQLGYFVVVSTRGACTIARRRYFKPEEALRNLPRINDRIKKSPVRVIDENENMVGVIRR